MSLTVSYRIIPRQNTVKSIPQRSQDHVIEMQNFLHFNLRDKTHYQTWMT